MCTFRAVRALYLIYYNHKGERVLMWKCFVPHMCIAYRWRMNVDIRGFVCSHADVSPCSIIIEAYACFPFTPLIYWQYYCHYLWKFAIAINMYKLIHPAITKIQRANVFGKPLLRYINFLRRRNSILFLKNLTCDGFTVMKRSLIPNNHVISNDVVYLPIQVSVLKER